MQGQVWGTLSSKFGHAACRVPCVTRARAMCKGRSNRRLNFLIFLGECIIFRAFFFLPDFPGFFFFPKRANSTRFLIYRHNASKRPPGAVRFFRCKKTNKDTPGRLSRYPGVFRFFFLGAFGPPGQHEKTRKKAHTLSNAGRYKKSRKKAHTSHTHTATARQQQQQVLSIMSQPSSTDKASSITDKSTDDQSTSLGEACVVLVKRRPHEGGHAGPSSRV